MDIVLFVLRTVFLVLIYVFIYIVFINLLKDLRQSETPPARPAAMNSSTGKPGIAEKSFVRSVNDSAVLKVETAPDDYEMNGALFELSGNTMLGRETENDVVLPDRFASKRHAAIHLRNGQYWLEDLDSSNGTFLNSLPVTKPAVLANGDQIRIGEIIFRFVRWDNAVEQNHRTRSGSAEE